LSALSARKLDVLFFAALVETVGCSRLELEVEPGATVEQVWRRLAERHPRLAELSYRPLVACDLEYADWDRVLDGVAELAFLPPVSGG
jgi:molybdopterin converting factor small subunit